MAHFFRSPISRASRTHSGFTHSPHLIKYAMTSNQTLKLSTISLALAILATGGQKPAVSESTDAKSLAYYTAHTAEAVKVGKKCKAFEDGEYSTMSPSKQQAWLETSDGINCNNAKQAWATAELQAYQKRLSDSANKY